VHHETIRNACTKKQYYFWAGTSSKIHKGLFLFNSQTSCKQSFFLESIMALAMSHDQIIVDGEFPLFTGRYCFCSGQVYGSINKRGMIISLTFDASAWLVYYKFTTTRWRGRPAFCLYSRSAWPDSAIAPPLQGEKADSLFIVLRLACLYRIRNLFGLLVDEW